MMQDFNAIFGNTDLYLIDAILKGYFNGRKTILDAGCGEGRNLPYFVNNNFDIYGNDSNEMALKMARMTYKTIPPSHFIHSNIESLNLPIQSFDAIICSAVLHFAESEFHFNLMLDKLYQLLKPSGLIFIRMATNVGLASAPTDMFTFKITQNNIPDIFVQKGWALITPWKSVVVEGKRSMGVFLLSKTC